MHYSRRDIAATILHVKFSKVKRRNIVSRKITRIVISKAHCITLITYRIRRHRLNNDIHSITSSIIHLSTRTSSLLLPHRSIFDITMIFVDASIKMYMYTNKTTLREIDGDRVHSFCRSEAFYFSNILPHPFLVPPIIFPP